MKWDAPRTLRQSMGFLHTWSGLLPGWLLFAVFVTGALSFFRQEISFWMQPELHAASPSPAFVDYGAIERILAAQAPGASRWDIALPDGRSPVVRLNWRNGQGSRRFDRQTKLVLDPQSGALLSPRQTAGGNFLYRFHFELHGIDRKAGRWIVGIATMFLMAALVSGIIIHKKIFIEFFTFRPGKGKRSWMDGHLLSSVASLPFHLAIAFSGLLLLGTLLLPTAYLGMPSGGRHDPPRAAPEKALISGPPARQANLGMLAREAEASWGGAPAGAIAVYRPGTPGAVVEIRSQAGEDMLQGHDAAPVRWFSWADGLPLEGRPRQAAGVVRQAFNAVVVAHRGFHAPAWVRWLLFAGGALGSLMIATGLVLWVDSRKKKGMHKGVRLAEILNVAVLAGLPLAIGTYFWANRLVPAALAGRAQWEIGIFFAAWGLAFLHAACRPGRAVWKESLAAAGALLAFLPFFAPQGASFIESLRAQHWIVAGFDLAALAAGLLLLFAAGRAGKGKGNGEAKPGVPRARAMQAQALALEGQGG